jgi:hypothetical protein
MKPLRLLLLFVAGCCLLLPKTASAQSAPPGYTFPKQFSAEQVVTIKGGQTMTSKIYSDNGKVRNEISMNGMQNVSIIRPDQQKMYSIMVAQKMIMVMPLDPEKIKKMMPPGSGGDEKVETVGPDTVDSVAATKYKITGNDGKVFFFWVDAAKQLPIKMASDDGSFTIAWKNFQSGPQDPALFEPPSDYQVLNVPSMPGAPPGAGQ